jgi:hypothetical protein
MGQSGHTSLVVAAPMKGGEARFRRLTGVEAQR